MNEKVKEKHLQRKAIVYVRQSSAHQVLHNEESKRLQYAMRQRVTSLGWRDVEVIDDDLGQSAATATKREGFQRMVSEVCLGKVGAIAAREVSRFARNNSDWHQLIEMCSLVETLLIDHEAIYDPRRGNDRLLLGLKGSLSEYELDLLRQRSVEARYAKAERGELIIILPVGFIKTSDKRIEKDPDLRVQRSIELAFEKCLEFGSARQALMWFLDHNLQFPSRRYGTEGWETVWRRPYYQSVIRILKEPMYAGAYAYGRTAEVSRVGERVLEKKRARKPLQEWKVLLRDQHEGYICWEQFERIQRMLSNNVAGSESQQPGAAKKGPALLAGLLRCRRCGRKLVVGYVGRNCTMPRYRCQRGFLDNGDPKCISFGGLSVDDAVAHEVLRAVQPCAVEAAMLAANDETQKQDDILGALLLELKAARYTADRAWKQYDAVDPENRLVADELERRWNIALEHVRDIEAKIEQEQRSYEKQHRPATMESLVELAKDLEGVWNDPETDIRLKKRILRTLIKEVVVDVDSQAGEIDILIHWNGGVHTNLRVPRRRRGFSRAHTSTDIVENVRVLALICSDRLIAAYLNRNGYLTGRGNRWSLERVTSLRSKRRIAGYSPKRKEQEGWMNLTEASAFLHVTSKTLRRAVDRCDVNAMHPLSDGPWIFNRSDLDRAKANGVFDGAYRIPARPDPRQQSLVIPVT